MCHVLLLVGYMTMFCTNELECCEYAMTLKLQKDQTFSIIFIPDIVCARYLEFLSTRCLHRDAVIKHVGLRV